jgi:iron(III) transport system permease protein
LPQAVITRVTGLWETAAGDIGPGGRGWVVAVAALPLVVVIALLVVAVMTAFRPAGDNVAGFTLEHFRVLYTNPFVYKTLLNTFVFAFWAVVFALIFGVPIAWLVERTDLPGRGLVLPLMAIGVLIPTFFTAMGWTFLLHSRIGIINQWIVKYTPFEQSPFNVATLPGMGFVEGVALSSLVFVMTAASFRAMDPSLEESAQIHGLRLFKRLWKVTLPLLWPSILAVSIYVFTIGLAAFDVPAIIGMGNRIFTFSTLVFTQVNPLTGAPNYGLASASSAIMVLIAGGLAWWYLRIMRKAHRYAVVTGKGYRPELVHLGKWAIAGWAFVILKLLLSIVLPFLVLVWASLLRFFQAPSMAAWSHASLANYEAITLENFATPVLNTVLLMLTVPTITVILGLCISWVVVRSNLRIAGTVDMLAFIPHAIPNLIFAVGAIIWVLFWLPNWIPLYGTLTLLIIVYVVTRISFATRVYNSSLVQIHKELDEAGYVFGLRTGKVIWKLLRPLMMPAILYTWLWMALLTYREFTMAALLVSSRQTVTLPLYIWGVWQGDNTLAAAVMVVTILCMTPLIALYFLVGRGQFQMTAR